MKKPMFIRVCAILGIGAGVIFAANGDGAKWTYEGTTLTQIVDEGVTPQVFTLNANGSLSMTTAGTATEIDLRDAALPEGAPKITYMARMNGGNTACQTFYFPEHVTSIDHYLFGNWTALTNVVWAEPITFDFKTWTFSGCSSLSRICLPEGLKTLGGSTFANCSKLEYVHLPSTLETIENGLPTSATLIEPCVPESVTTLGGYCFWKSTMTNGVEIGFGKNADGTPKKVTMGNYAFNNCKKVPWIRIGPGVEIIPSGALGSPSSAKWIEFGENVTNVSGTVAVWGGGAMTNVIFKSKKTVEITSSLFTYLTKVREITWSGWFEYSTTENPFGSWKALQCRFIYPGNNVKWAAYVTDTTKVLPWAECSDSDKSTYKTKYGDDAVEPVGISIAVNNGLPRTYLVSDGTVLDGYVLNVTKPNAAFGEVTVSPEISEEEVYKSGANVTLTVQEKEGVTFLGWSGDVAEADKMSKTITVTMDSIKNITPEFEAPFFLYEDGILSDGQWEFNASGEAAAITVGTPTKEKANGVLDLTKPIKGGGTIVGIGNRAFSGVTLQGLSLPTTLTTIGLCAFESQTKATGNLRVGFATDGEGQVVETVFVKGWTRPNREPVDSYAFAYCSMLGPKIELGPGVRQVPPYAFAGVGKSLGQPMELVIGAGLTNAIDSAFANIGGTNSLTVTIEANPFDGGGAVFGTTTYRMRFILNGREWKDFVRNETYVTPWSGLEAETRQKYWDKFPEATFGAGHPYGLTTADAAALSSGLPASSWVFCADAAGGMVIRIQ